MFYALPSLKYSSDGSDTLQFTTETPLSTCSVEFKLPSSVDFQLNGGVPNTTCITCSQILSSTMKIYNTHTRSISSSFSILNGDSILWSQQFKKEAL